MSSSAASTPRSRASATLKVTIQDDEKLAPIQSTEINVANIDSELKDNAARNKDIKTIKADHAKFPPMSSLSPLALAVDSLASLGSLTPKSKGMAKFTFDSPRQSNLITSPRSHGDPFAPSSPMAFTTSPTAHTNTSVSGLLSAANALGSLGRTSPGLPSTRHSLAHSNGSLVTPSSGHAHHSSSDRDHSYANGGHSSRDYRTRSTKRRRSPLGGQQLAFGTTPTHTTSASGHLAVATGGGGLQSVETNKRARHSSSGSYGSRSKGDRSYGNPGNSENYSRNDSKSEGTRYAASGAMDTSSDDPTSSSRRTSGGRPSARDNTPSSASRSNSSRTQHLNGGTSHVGHTTPQTLNNGRGPTHSNSSHPPTRGGNSRYGSGGGNGSGGGTSTSRGAQSNGVARRDSSKGGMPPPPSNRDPAPGGGASRSLSPKNRNGVGPRTVIGSTTPAIPGMTARAQSMNGIATMSASSAAASASSRGSSSASSQSTSGGASSAQLPAEDTKRTPGGLSSKKQKNRTRKRAAVACVSCHNAKTGCEGGIPCARCIRLKKDHTCERFEHRKKGRPKKGRFEMMGYPSHLLGPDGQSLYNPGLHPSLAAAAMAHSHPAAYLAARAGLSNPMQMYLQAQAAHAQAQAYGGHPYAAQYAAASQMAAAGMSGSHFAAAAHAAAAGAGGGNPMSAASAAAAAHLSELRSSMNPSPTPLMGTDPSMAAGPGILAPNGVTPLTPTGRGVTPPPPGMLGGVDLKYGPGSGTVAAPSPSLLPGEKRRERFRNTFFACWERQMTAQKIQLILENDIFHEAFRFVLSFTALILSHSEYQVHENRVRRMCEDARLTPEQISFPVQLYRFHYEVDQNAPISNDALPACITSLRMSKPDNAGNIRVAVSANKAMLDTLHMSIHDVKDEVQQTGVPWHFSLMHEEDWEQQVSLFLDAIQRLRFSSTMRLHHQSKTASASSSPGGGTTVTPALTTMSYEMVPPGVIGAITACGIPYPSDMVLSPAAGTGGRNPFGVGVGGFPAALAGYASASAHGGPSASSSVSRSASPMPLPGVVGMVNSAPPPLSKFTPMAAGTVGGSASSHMSGGGMSVPMPVMPLPRRGAASSPGMPIGATKMEQHA